MSPHPNEPVGEWHTGPRHLGCLMRPTAWRPKSPGIEAALLSRPGANPQATRAAAAAAALAPAASTEAEDAIARHQRLLNEMEQTQGILNSCLDAELAAMHRSSSRIQGLIAICFASAVPAVTPPHTGA